MRLDETRQRQRACICVRILLHVCPQTAAGRVLVLLYCVYDREGEREEERDRKDERERGKERGREREEERETWKSGSSR